MAQRHRFAVRSCSLTELDSSNPFAPQVTSLPQVCSVHVTLPTGHYETVTVSSSESIQTIKERAWLQALSRPPVPRHFYAWHGPIGAAQAEAKLRSAGIESCYLFRRLPSCTQAIYLSILHASKVAHLEFAWQPKDDELVLQMVGPDAGSVLTFASVQAVEDHFKRQLVEQLGCTLGTAVEAHYATENKLRSSLVRASNMTLVECDEVIVQVLQGETGHQQVWLSLPDVATPQLNLLYDELQAIALALALKGRRSPSVMLHCVYRDPLAFAQRACLQPDIADVLGPAWALLEDPIDPALQQARLNLMGLAWNCGQVRDTQGYLLNTEIASTPLPAHLHERLNDNSFTMTVTLNPSHVRQAVRTVTVRHDVTVLRALRKILHLDDALRKTADLPVDPEPGDYCLQVPRQFEYLHGSTPLSQSVYVRRCLLRNDAIQFNLASITQAVSHLEADLCSSTDNDPILNRLDFTPRANPSHTDMTKGKASELELQRITSAWTVTRPLSLTVTEIMGNPDTRRADCIELQLLHADVQLETSKRLPLGDVTSERHSVAHFQTRVCDLPLGACLQATLVRHSNTDGKLIAHRVATGTCSVYTQGAVIKQDRQLIPVLAPDGTLVARLVVAFPLYAHQVLYPSAHSDYVEDADLMHQDQIKCKRQESRLYLKGDPNVSSDVACSEIAVDLPDPGPELLTLDLPSDIMPLVGRLGQARFGFKLTLRKIKKRKVRCFTGKELLGWLQTQLEDAPVENSVLLAQRFLRHGVMESATKTTSPLDDNFEEGEFYQLTAFVRVRCQEGDSVIGQADAKQARVHLAEEQMAQANVDMHDSRRLAELRNLDLLVPLTPRDKRLLFRRRHECSRYPLLLPKFLVAIDWSKAWHVREAYRLVESWLSSGTTVHALPLLLYHFADPYVRRKAVEALATTADDDFEAYLLQLVQVLRFEVFDDSPLARLLLQRALRNQRVGLALFWHLKTELETPALQRRAALLLEAYCFAAGPLLPAVVRQVQGLQRLDKVAEACAMQKRPVASRVEQLRKALHNQSVLELPLVMAYNASLAGSQLKIAQCRVMDSKKKPLWLQMVNAADPKHEFAVLYKRGDDLRQDMLTIQMLRLMQKLWHSEGLDLHLTPYGCVATSSDSGVIEIVPRACTVASIQKAAGGSLAAFRDEPLLEWLTKETLNDADALNAAKDKFTISCAGYCVATYVLGIGDRHNDNICVTSSGDFFHIDYGHFLGNIKTKFGVKRERAPFVLTPDFVHVMDKRDGKRFQQFVRISVQAYLVLRRHAQLIISLFAMMLSTGIPELRHEEDLSYLRMALNLDARSEQEAATAFEELIYECLNKSWTTQVNFLAHNLAH
eukprot:m.282513 g.282513  ORF g.282513 m.282513 type:complete len:1348 (-) comp17751_c0_seq1:4505-8548(-)